MTPRFNHSVLLYKKPAEDIVEKPVLSLAAPVIAQASKSLEVVQTESPEDFTEACKNAALSADAIFVAGGDGTAHLAIQVLTSLDKSPVLGILPDGTCNDFARTLEIPLPLDEAALVLAEGDIQEVDTVSINDKSFLNFAGIGVITDASVNIDPHLKERYGKLSYFMSGLQSLREATPFNLTLKVDDTEYEKEAVLVLVMNGRFIGTHMFPLESLSPFDGLLDVFIVQTSSIAAVFEWLSLSEAKLAAGELEHIIHLQGRRITIQTDQEMEVDTDGEVYLKTPVTIEVQPKKLQILTPKKTVAFTEFDTL